MPFNSTTQPKKKNRKPRGVGIKNSTIEAIRNVVSGGEMEYLEEIIRVSRGDDKNKPNPQLMLAVMQRIQPAPRSTLPMVYFDFDEKLTYRENCLQILKAISIGKLAPDIGAQLISSLGAVINIDKVSDLREDFEGAHEEFNLKVIQGKKE